MGLPKLKPRPKRPPVEPAGGSNWLWWVVLLNLVIVLFNLMHILVLRNLALY